MKHASKLVAALVIAAAPGAFAQEAQQPEETLAVAQNASVTAQTYMVAAANPIAGGSRARGIGCWRVGGGCGGGVQIMLNLVEPQSSGIGGGAFALYWDASEGALTTLDGREQAPLDADGTYWFGPDGKPVGFWDAVIGGRSVGVPGTLKLLEGMHAAHGRTPWADLFEPTINLAEAGFEISPRMPGHRRCRGPGIGPFPGDARVFLQCRWQPQRGRDAAGEPGFRAHLAPDRGRGR